MWCCFCCRLELQIAVVHSDCRPGRRIEREEKFGWVRSWKSSLRWNLKIHKSSLMSANPFCFVCGEGAEGFQWKTFLWRFSCSLPLHLLADVFFSRWRRRERQRNVFLLCFCLKHPRIKVSEKENISPYSTNKKKTRKKARQVDTKKRHRACFLAWLVCFRFIGPHRAPSLAPTLRISKEKKHFEWWILIREWKTKRGNAKARARIILTHNNGALCAP